MSAQKLIGEADKLFEKGKTAEGFAKLKEAFQLEPLNQNVATKLANYFLQKNEPLEAAKVYSGLAKRLSDAGKSQVAIAIFKQALDLSPGDIELRTRFAQECESVGKLGDAFLQGQIALTYYLRRKKFFDASNVLPLMARAQPKDEKIKMAWAEVLQFCQAEQKLIHFIVALCGPPGLVSQEFPQGGDPVALSPALYEAIKRLVPFFPRDPKIAYAVAWSAFRRGIMKDFYYFLRECLRREPDFCLGILLFARALAESSKLNESLFIYRYYKERMTADKSVDMLTLNRLLEAFLEKNGWIKFSEDSGDLLDTPGFLKSMTGLEKETDDENENSAGGEGEGGKDKDSFGSDLSLPPAEIEIGGLPSADEGMEILTTTGQSIEEARKQKRPLKLDSADPLKIQAELIKDTIKATIEGMGGGAPATTQQIIQPVVLPAIQAAASQELPSSVQKTISEKIQETAQAPKPLPAAQEPIKVSEPSKPQAVKKEEEEVPEELARDEVEFTSLIKREDLEAIQEPEPAPVASPEQKSPTADATRVMADSDKTLAKPLEEGTVVAPLQSDATQVSSVKDEVPEEATVASALSEDSSSHAPSPEEVHDGGAVEEAGPKRPTFNPLEHANLGQDTNPSLKLEEQDERTQMFSPMDVLDAAKVMKNRELGEVQTKMINLEELQKSESEKKGASEEKEETIEGSKNTSEADKTNWRELKVEGEQTKIFDPAEAVKAIAESRRAMEISLKPQEPKPPAANSGAEETKEIGKPAEGEGLFTDGEATVILTRPLTQPAMNSEDMAAEKEATASPANQEKKEGADKPMFEPIPTAALSPDKPGAVEDRIDLGDDLLEGPTRIFSSSSQDDHTEQLIRDLKEGAHKKSDSAKGIDLLFKKADRYAAKRNYYLARKALRHAQAVGADEEAVRKKLREIRKLEFPDSMYNTISSDEPREKVDTADLLGQLEREFQLNAEDEDLRKQSGPRFERQILDIMRSHDARTILDFGVGLHEMGLYRDAESLFMRMVEEFPEHAFDAYYLAAVSKMARNDFVGAASILKLLSGDSAKTEQEKIQIYYALGEAFEKLRQAERSKEFYQKVAEIDSNYRNIRSKLED